MGGARRLLNPVTDNGARDERVGFAFSLGARHRRRRSGGRRGRWSLGDADQLRSAGPEAEERVVLRVGRWGTRLVAHRGAGAQRRCVRLAFSPRRVTLEARFGRSGRSAESFSLPIAAAQRELVRGTHGVPRWAVGKLASGTRTKTGTPSTLPMDDFYGQVGYEERMGQSVGSLVRSCFLRPPEVAPGGSERMVSRIGRWGSWRAAPGRKRERPSLFPWVISTGSWLVRSE